MRCTRATFVALLMVSLIGWPTAGQTPTEHPRLAQALELARVWLEAQRAYEQIPGVSAAIVHDQRILWAGAYGHADLASQRDTLGRSGTRHRFAYRRGDRMD